MVFEVSGVEISPLIPFGVALVVSFFTSMGGVSGAFLLLPFQMSVLGFTSPAVSPTNLVFNIIAIPSGVYRFIKEGRMAWPLAWVITAGTLPGVFVGAIVRIKYLPDPKNFKFFAGWVLLYIGIRLLLGLIKKGPQSGRTEDIEKKFQKSSGPQKGLGSLETVPGFRVETVHFSLLRYTYRFYGETFTFHTAALFGLTLLVGVVGGIYGIGGGAIIAPFLVGFWNLPVYTIAGAALLGTLISSIAGVFFYVIMAPYFADTGYAISPDWLLGLCFGAGGFLGIYLGARFQKYMSAVAIKVILALVILFVAARYISGIVS